MKKTDHSSLLLPAPPGTTTASRPYYEASLIASHVIMMRAFYTCAKTVFFDFSNAESALAFYGVYHREPLNQLIHFVGVPLILWTLLVVASHMVLPPLLSNTPPMIPRLPGIPAHYMTWATMWVILYATFYFMNDAVGAALYLPFLYTYYATAVRWTVNDQQKAVQQAKKDSNNNKDKTPAISWMGTGRLVSWACFIHALSWYVQIHPGHLIIEGASPAVLANLGGALMAAPLFAFYEGVWFCGLQSGMQERVANLVQEYTLELCQKGVDMRVCEQVLGNA